MHFATLLFSLAATPCLGHDFWIEPTSFRPAAGAAVGLGLRVGEHFTGDALPRDERLLERFVVAGPPGEAAVAGVNGRHPAGVLALTEPGLYVVGYASRDSIAELSAEKLARYVEEEGLEPQLADATPAEPPIRDAFSRCAKALLVVPGGETAGYDRRLGLPLELVPLADPHAAPGASGSSAGRPAGLPLELLYRGEPLAGVLVTAMLRSDPLHPVKAWTDRKGRVRLDLARAGVWLIKAVRVERTPEGSEVDYRSLWASLTFEITE